MPESVLSRRTADQMRRHRELQRKSGLTITAYCKRENINPSIWWYWRKRLLSKKLFSNHLLKRLFRFFSCPPSRPTLKNSIWSCPMERGLSCLCPVRRISCDKSCEHFQFCGPGSSSCSRCHPLFRFSFAFSLLTCARVSIVSRRLCQPSSGKAPCPATCSCSSTATGTG